jgi:hypothetical protein
LTYLRLSGHRIGLLMNFHASCSRTDYAGSCSRAICLLCVSVSLW